MHWPAINQVRTPLLFKPGEAGLRSQTDRCDLALNRLQLRPRGATIRIESGDLFLQPLFDGREHELADVAA
jgi:hypothetical protein